MKIKQEEQEDVVILRLGGKLMGGPDADAFQQTIRDLVERGRRNVLVDMGDVSWVNSTGLGILISGYTTLKNAGGVLKLVRVNKRIDQIFMVTKLHTIFDSFEDETRALASF
jgi:anti-sigma B factor antagonist